VPEDAEEDAEEEAEDDVVVVSPPVLEVEAASLVVKEPPDPPAPPAPPPPLVAPVLSPVPALWLVTVPDEAHPVLNTPKIKERVDPRTRLCRMIRDLAETRWVYKHLPLAPPREHVDARLGTLHHRRRLTLAGSTFCVCFHALYPFTEIEAPRMLKAVDPPIFFLLGFALTLSVVACSAAGTSTTGSTQSTTGGGGAGGEDPLSTATTTSSSSAESSSTGVGDAGPDPDAACGLITEQAKSTPLDIYIAFDRSSSMVGNKWDSAKLGLSAFVNDPDSAGIQVALNFFPLESTPTTCMQSDYSPPKVAFASLPGNAKPITDAMAAASPSGFSTPIYPALGGAILAAKAYAQANAGHAAAVLLVTDGNPEGPAPMCGSVNPEETAQIAILAAAGVSYGIKTFVVGLPGVTPAVVNQIAKAGGTEAAIVVSTLNVQAELQKALAKVRGEALPCEYEIPEKVEGGDVETGSVNVLITPNGGTSDILPQDVKCNAEGWKYDNAAKPTKIIICPASCQALKTDFGAKVQILLGCKTQVAN